MSLRLLTPILLSLAGLVVIVAPITLNNSRAIEDSQTKTYFGSNTVRYRLNNQLIEENARVRAEVTHTQDLFYLNIWMGDARQDRITFVLKEEDIQPTVFDLDNPSKRYLSFLHHSKSCTYRSDDYYTGVLMIHEFDTVNHVIAGSFEFTAFADNCETLLRVEDGEFDATYQEH